MRDSLGNGRSSSNIVLCFDGTNNEFGEENTNIVRLVQALDQNPEKQLYYYDPGVGTLPEPGAWTAIAKWFSKVAGLAFGGGLTWKVQEAYCYLMQVWEPGDNVFLFGFSRGAYTARVLAGLLHTLGLLPRGNANLVPYVMRVFEKVRETPKSHGRRRKPTKWNELCEQFRQTFTRQPYAGDDRRFRIHFLGLWDTVSSVGWVWDPARFAYTTHNPSVDRIRHAISIDERRWFFRQNRMFKTAAAQDHLEVWFAGVHCDVGGGYPKDQSSLWRLSFDWMVSEAKAAGLLFDSVRLQEAQRTATSSTDFWKDRQHESLTPKWWIAECIWKLRSLSFSDKVNGKGGFAISLPYVSFGGHRQIQNGTLIDRSVLQRIRDTKYAPRNLAITFLDYVRTLTHLPPSLAYTAAVMPSRKSTVIQTVMQFIALVLGLGFAALIHDKIHRLTDIDTFRSSIAVALSFFPGIAVGYFSVWLYQCFSRIEKPRVPVAAVLNVFVSLLYVFRALTLLCRLPVLSNWAQEPVNLLVKFLQSIRHVWT